MNRYARLLEKKDDFRLEAATLSVDPFRSAYCEIEQMELAVMHAVTNLCVEEMTVICENAAREINHDDRGDVSLLGYPIIQRRLFVLNLIYRWCE